jgi:predicted RND superfamily exporter protein
MEKVDDMRHLITGAFDKTAIIGVVGTGISFTLSNVSVFISIGVGLLSGIHVGVQLYQRYKEMTKRRINKKRRATDK